MWRVKELIALGKIEVLGDVNKSWKEFDIKLPGVQQTEATQSQELTV
jgi:hypothetical protein